LPWRRGEVRISRVSRASVMRMENEEEQKRLVAMEKGRGEDLQGK
jgi:hypothetical protein